jgi:pimeloyl-ACP methyl ester carboxylesterase
MHMPPQTITYPAQSQSAPHSEDLLVLLPGIGDYASAFADHSFVEMLRDEHYGIDVVAVNAHFKYYEAHNLVEQLHQHIVLPALVQGYRRIHFAGVSLGGFGVLLYQREHPELVASAILLAPYLGEEVDYAEFQRWRVQTQSGDAPPPLDAKNIWPWLTMLSADQLATMYLAYGEQDKFSVDNSTLGQLLPSGNVLTMQGKHN